MTYSDGVTDGIRRERERCATIAEERAAIWLRNPYSDKPDKATEAETIAREIRATEKTYPKGRKMDTKVKDEVIVETTVNPDTGLPATRRNSDRDVLPSKAATEREPRPRRTRSEEKQMVSEIASAIAKITAEVGPVAKRGENKFHNYKYATMGDVLLQLTPLMAKHGLVVMQNETERSMFDEGRVLAVQYEFTIAHSSGEVWPEKPRQTGVCRCRDSKGGWDDKAFNKAHTAARKYFLLALFQIATADNTDDADEDRGQQRQWGPRGTDRRPTQPEQSNLKPIPQKTLDKMRQETEEYKAGPIIDEETGEIIEKPADRPVSIPADGGPSTVTTSHVVSTATVEAPAESSPSAGATTDGLEEVLIGADIGEREELDAELARLTAAAEEGMMKLRNVWNTVPAALRATLEAAKERLKKRAAETDEARHSKMF